MLKKLLRYDLKSVFKYWWIAALSSLGLSVMGGGCISIISADREPPAPIMVLIVFALIFMVIGLVAFSILSYILIYVRFYKNFFTDEGYLTFTLPVKRSQLINSKLITNLVTMLSTGAVLMTDIFVILVIGSDFLNNIGLEYIPTLFEDWTAMSLVLLLVLILEVIVILILSFAFSSLFVFCCITFASVISKKAKIITAIGIYYVANGMLSGFVQIIYIFGMPAVIDWLSAMPDGWTYWVLVLILLGIALIMALFCLLLYTLEYFMLDRKLNLA